MIVERLIKATSGCRNDMHEPDEQNVTAKFAGYSFDNAMGDHPIRNCGEMTIGIFDLEKDTVYHMYCFPVKVLKVFG